MTYEHPVAEFSLCAGPGVTLDDVTRFVDLVASLGVSPSARVELRWDSLTVRAFVHRLTPRQPRDERGRFIRAAS